MSELVPASSRESKVQQIQRPTLESVVRAAFDAFMNAKGGWDGDFEPLIEAVVDAVRSYFEHDVSAGISAAVERELRRVMGAK